MVLSFNDISEEHLSQIGGKAKGLFYLSANGFTVPEWCVIPHSGFSQDLNSLVTQAVALLPPSDFYAVRSSAIGEDGSEQSWAGQFETFLFVTEAQLAEKIEAVHQSVQSDRVKSYAGNTELKMSVVVQIMINADVSGVAFSINPVSGNRKQALVNSVFGLGEGLVSGELNADIYIIESNKIIKNLSSKDKKAVMKSNGGIQYVSIDKELQNTPTLNDQQLGKIKKQLQKLYGLSGRYQDIEFAISNQQLYLLQARPVTTHATIPDTSNNYMVWDNSNIIESYPGLTGPLTFSFIIKMYERVYRQMLELFGVKISIIEKNKYVFTNMLGLMHGRVYYNLYSWYKVLSLLPGYSLNAGFMERMMGVKEKFELKDYEKKSKFGDILDVVRMVFGLYRNIRKLPRNTHRFETHFEKTMKTFWAQDLNELSPTELLALYRELEDELLSKWKPPLVNDFFAMIYFGLVPKMLEKAGGEQAVNLQNGLLSGANDIVSAEPARLIQGIVNEIKAYKKEHTLFKYDSSKNIIQYIESSKQSKAAILIKEYLDKFGDRCVGELKLETKTYRQQPEKFIDIVKSHLDKEAVENLGKSSELRNKAEKDLKKIFKAKPLKKLVFKHVLKKARTLVSNRENLRFRRTQAYGLVRDIFNALGKRFYAENVLNNADDIFYLTVPEVFNYIEGKAVSVDLKNIAELRQQEYVSYKSKTDLDERFKTFGIPYIGNKFKNDKTTVNDGSGIKGIGCCAGKIKQRIRIVTDPANAGALNGEILVTSSTDPGWVTLFSSISGIIVERGSLLSHSAIVSREMGIPCIVGVNDAMKLFTDGELVEMDGASGIITKCS